MQNIQQCLTNFGTPDLWVFTLGGNSVGASDRAEQIQAVIDVVGPDAKILWTTMGFTHVQDNWWLDGVHMISNGYAVRNAFVAQQSIYASLAE